MYLFARNGTCVPNRLFEAVQYAADIAAKVSSITGLEMSAWQADFGAPITSLSWTTTVQSHAELGAARDKLMADSGYVEAVMAGSELFATPAEDAVIDIVATVGEGGHRGDFASMVTAQCAPGKIGEAMAWGVDMMNHVAGVTGRDGVFGRGLYGPFATVGWISLANSLDEIDAATEAMSADAEYVGKVDGSGGLFLPGSGSTRLTRRIG